MSEHVAEGAKPKDVASKTPAEAKPKTPAKKSLSKMLLGFDLPDSKGMGGMFKMDKEYLLVALLFFILLIGSYGHALNISAPESVVVNDKATFYVKLTNDSTSTANVVVNFYSPVRSEVFAPKTILPNSTSEAKIVVYNNSNISGDVDATIEAMVGQKADRNSIILSFQKKSASNTENAIGAFFSIGALNEDLEKLSPFEWVLFWIMVLIAAVLLIAFIARVNRRV